MQGRNAITAIPCSPISCSPFATNHRSSYTSGQAAAYTGYVTVHWDKVEHDALSVLDQNGNGEVRACDVVAVASISNSNNINYK